MTMTVSRFGRTQLFLRRGFGRPLFEPVFLGTRWALECEIDDNAVQMYATDADSAQTYEFDPRTGRATPGLPDWVKRALRSLLHGTAVADCIHNFSTWLFKWDSKDHAFEISTGDWDPRDL